MSPALVPPARCRRVVLFAGLTSLLAALAFAAPRADRPGSVGFGGSALAQAPSLPSDTYVLTETWPLPETPSQPVDLALGSGGDLYVLDGRRNAVMAFDPQGRLRSSWRQAAEGEAFVPLAVTVDHARDQVHVLWERYRFESDRPVSTGIFLDTRQPDGTALRPLQALGFLRAASDLAVHPESGNLYISGEGRIFRVRPGPVPGGSLDVGDTRGAAGRIAVTPDERIALVRPVEQTVAVYSRDWQPLARLDLGGHAPVAVAADAAGRLQVLVRGGSSEDPGSRMLLRFDAEGGLIDSRTVAGLGAPTLPELDWPWALALAPDGMALSTGSARFQVLSYDAGGALRLRLYGATIHGPYRPNFSPPSNRAGLTLASSAAGGVLAFDARDAQVLRFDESGRASFLAGTPDEVLDLSFGEGAYFATTSDGRVLGRPLPPATEPSWEAACDCALGGRIAAGPGAVYVSRPRELSAATFNPADGLRLRSYRFDAGVGLWPSDLEVAPDGRLYTGDLVAAQVQGWRRPEAPDLIWQAGLLAGPRRLAAGRWADSTVIAAAMADGYVELHDAADGNLLARWRPLLPDGSTPDTSDIALGRNGEVYIADARARAVRVFAPGISVPPTPVDEPSPSPTPSELACTVRGDKRAAPSTLVLGETTAVTLTLAARCPSSSKLVGADIVLIMDRSGSMSGDKIEAARGAARAFAELLDVRHHRLGLVSFSDNATVDVPLTTAVAAVVDGLEAIQTGGETNMAASIESALTQLQSAGRPEALPVIVLLTDGQYTASTADPRVAAGRARNWGAQIYAIGLGEDVVASVLADLTGDAGRTFFAPTPSELYPIYSQILRLVLASLAGNLIVDDQLGDGMRYIDGSASPSALVSTGRLRWGRSLLPATGITLSYRLQPQALGCQATNKQALADYTDADGVRRQFAFPVPTVCVVTPSPTPTATATPTATPTPQPRPVYLPLLSSCLPSKSHADVVLLIDTSDSMAGAKLDQARAAALAFVERLDLPRDQAAVVGFNSEARLASRLTGDRAALEAAIHGLGHSRGTQIDKALLAGLNELLGARHRPGNRPVIVLLSDGAHNGPLEDVHRAADEARGIGALLYAVGLGADADRALLERVAGPERTYFALDGEALTAIYREIAATIPCQ